MLNCYCFSCCSLFQVSVQISSEVFCRNFTGGSSLRRKRKAGILEMVIFQLFYILGSIFRVHQGHCFLLYGYVSLFHYNLIWLNPQGCENCMFSCILSTFESLSHSNQKLCSPPLPESSLYMDYLKLKCHSKWILQ